MTEEQLIEIFENTESNFTDFQGLSRAFLGLQILAKYTTNLIEAAEHDIIYCAYIKDIIENITEEDAIQLAKLNFHIDEDSIAKFV